MDDIVLHLMRRLSYSRAAAEDLRRKMRDVYYHPTKGWKGNPLAIGAVRWLALEIQEGRFVRWRSSSQQ